MAIRPGARLAVSHETAFPFGVFATGPAVRVESFNDGKRTGSQEIDPVNNLPVWQVPVMDGDPELPANAKAFAIKIAAYDCPVIPPSSVPGMPFIPVVFEGLTVTPYVNNNRRLAYSYRATGLGPGEFPQAPAPQKGR